MIVEKVRALIVVICASAVALATARQSLAESLILRGDTFLYRTKPIRALAYYRRAMWFDPSDEVAVDRFAFAALLGRDASLMHVALDACSRLLLRKPDEWTVRFDRALLFRAVGKVARAEEDFATVGRAKRDARIMAFAGFTARSLGEHALARRLFSAAKGYSAQFQPAQRALDRERWVR